ncbi:DUF1684 domain-containing protein [Frigoriglobus tundricola]|uniref:DUF1684 domain-containing protein n=1 Tax=Frigoriglobus tundricola TaxID=2774151 RepID=A0A6M5Z704_9BACT|nr:DUF1684 domain-containing protein [Frigoriglobus tundricola]QJX01141.1 hypothetical protein FTUN_8780 [Frigoriglobus tundricola]
MRTSSLVALVLASLATAQPSQPPSYPEQIQKWRATREEKLRAENGWLSLAGRFPLKDGANTFGTGSKNDIVFPAALNGTGPERLGTLHVDTAAKQVTLKLAEGVSMVSGDKSFSGERVLGTNPDKRDWVGLERLSMHVIERDGKYVLRLADSKSPVRKNFAGCVWYAPDEAFKVEAKFLPYPEGKALSIMNVIDEVSKQPCPGYAEFKLKGEVYKLDAIKEGDGLFFVFRDDTAGDTTYKPGRFLTIEKQPQANETFTLDFNKAYNPPCAFSEYTTCPLPPRQNVLKVRIEAGEKYREKR